MIIRKILQHYGPGYQGPINLPFIDKLKKKNTKNLNHFSRWLNESVKLIKLKMKLKYKRERKEKLKK